MVNFKLAVASLLSFATLVSCHYTFPTLVVNGQDTGEWVNVRQTNNYQSGVPVTNVSSPELRCYTSGTTAGTATVSAGQTIGIRANQAIYHPGVANVYMAKAPGSVNGWDGSGTVWFKVHEISAITNLSEHTVTWPSTGLDTISFTLPKSLPNGEYLVRVEHIALHTASAFGLAQFYISCAQIKVTNGGSGTPEPLVAIPGVYTGYEPGLIFYSYYPTTSYKQPGPVSSIFKG
ncbi:glycoside hydrolase [Panaeolus papilionaceus]|nr:glycoside hydrolase [Panaeolus papilionaceus]